MTQPPVLPPEGWYPNPENTQQQRWWDGQAWTEHVAVGAPMAPGYEPVQPQQPQQPASAAYPSYQPQQQPYGYQQPYAQPQQQYPAQQQYPGYQQYPAQPAYGSYNPAMLPKGVLPDGAVVVGWWWRVLARIIDGIIVGIPSLIIAIPLFRQTIRDFGDYIDRVDAADRAGLPTPDFSVSISGRDVILFSLLSGLILVVYELVLLKACSATVGKLVCGLRVRDWQSRGPLSWASVGKRVLSFQVATSVPQVGGLYYLIDVLWPLWDGHRQALHDKVASTAVVKKHDAVPAQQQQNYGGATGFGGYQSF